MREHRNGDCSVYLTAARFTDGRLAEHTYTQLHLTLRRIGLDSLSAHYLTDADNSTWYIALVGELPTEEQVPMLLAALSPGEFAALPERWGELLSRHYRVPRKLLSL